jgi:glycosyltransferase involved in cell wall biosynthesis
MLKEAVESVLKQTRRPIEIIISDDGSMDSTPELGRALEQEYPGVIRYLWNPNRGAGPAREAGRLLARGEFIQYLDSDDTLWPRKFEVQVQALRRRPECGAAYGWIRLCPEDGLPIEKPHKWSGRELPTLFPWLLVDRWWNTDAPLFRRSVCDAVGPWSDLRYSQDWEYDGRVGALGTKLVYCDEFVCDQLHHAADRQTGHGKWLAPADRVRFFSSLFDSATKAGVSTDSPEMRHFSRWVFSQARQCGQMGNGQVASGLFALSVCANGGTTIDMRAYALLAGIVGWQLTGRICCWLDRLVKHQSSMKTKKLSWMKV